MARKFLRKAGIGRLVYRCYYVPFARVRESLAAGGPIEQWRTARGRTAMEMAARELPLLPSHSTERASLEVHVLTGRRFWYQTAFCLWSLARATDRMVTPMILDDGTLRGEDHAALTRVFPAARLLAGPELLARLDAALPASRFPSLRSRRETFPLLRKLTDVHAGSRGWKLFVDSDVLFFRVPTLLVNWLAAPAKPLRATDVENAYGYSLELLGELAGRAVDERVNTGLLGLRSDAIDWDRLEFWCRTLIERAGTHYYQEQALVALLLAGQEHLVAPISDYVTFPKPPEIDACSAVMHHYVADSKRWYFRQNWRRVLCASPLETRSAETR